ncbi:MAG TPA: tRNA pseudouridine(55) synthase TruB [Blastocatellia bacterium]|nr:tRNA pseudouridine(55) synthase TruB [Blastocatellia bacterium]
MDQKTLPSDGILVIDKPADWTSHDVVAKVRKLMRTRRVGHTGTLDPFATGVLVVCLNRATRLAQFLTGDDKEYLATVRFGYATDTGDLTGTATGPVTDARHLTAEMIEAALAPLRGRIRQIPPMYSAKKVGGVKLYEMARRGEEIERAAIEVEIKELELLPVRSLREREQPARLSDEAGRLGTTAPVPEAGEQAACAPGCVDFELRVVCSSGTYIRALAEDIGKALGIGAHLAQLRRTRAGRCDLSRAVTLERLAELAEAGRTQEALSSMAEALAMPEVRLNADEAARVAHGNAVRRAVDYPAGTLLQLTDGQQLLAVAEYRTESRTLQPRVVLTGE